MKDFLPVSKKDMQKLGWADYDFLYVIGDAYVDHPSFGPAIISRVLESHGYRVAILSQPDWRSKEDFLSLGKPLLGVLVCGGNIDSMVNHYTAAKKVRSEDSYSPGGEAGHCPDRAVIVYCNRIREAFGDIPIIIGGIEASLRRFAHYDYWDNKVRRSILIDSRANLLLYGMGEHQIVQMADQLKNGKKISEITNIPGSCYLTKSIENLDVIECPSFEEVREDKRAYAIACRIQYEEQDPIRGHNIAQKHQDKYLIQLKPSMPLTRSELDRVYALPYMRNYHPMYEPMGGVPAIKEVKFSIASSRGCFGACRFCALTLHQGRIVQSRSAQSIVEEARKMTHEPDFKGYIHDVGGPTANFRAPACQKQLKSGTCKNRECLWPTPCKNMDVSHKDYVNVLRKVEALPGIKKVFIRSGIRFDYLMLDPDKTFFKKLCRDHISGQLKVAPEHVSPNVLAHMGKPKVEVYNAFCDEFYQICKQIGKEQYLVPYLMSSHPGSTLQDAINLACYLNQHKINPRQVQDFYPTPGTIATCMFYTELDPFTLKKVYVAKSFEEKAEQRALLQFRNPANYDLVEKALKKAHREDLIGFTSHALIRPRKPNSYGGKKSAAHHNDSRSGRGAKPNSRHNASSNKANAQNKSKKKSKSFEQGKHGSSNVKGRFPKKQNGKK